jgi:membrane-bound lytic murein transglycosylase D
MKAGRIVPFLFLVGCLSGPAQEDLTLLDDLVRDGLEWAQQNLDQKALSALDEVDQSKVQSLTRNLQKRLREADVGGLASVQETAASLLPLLQSHPETHPYAAWLQARMDYFEAAKALRRSTPSMQVEPGLPVRPVINPAPEAQREVWREQLAARPRPKEARPYVARLKPVFAAAKVPSELVWMAEVESSFNPSARSPAGAAGLYQLMPRTAQSLGVSLRPTDERLDPEKNASAAAQYLRYLHGQFKDWRLAVAAYNAGEGNLQHLLAKHKAKTFDQVSRHLPAETQMYVPKVEATLRKREGVNLASLPAPTS